MASIFLSVVEVKFSGFFYLILLFRHLKKHCTWYLKRCKQWSRLVGLDLFVLSRKSYIREVNCISHVDMVFVLYHLMLIICIGELFWPNCRLLDGIDGAYSLSCNPEYVGLTRFRSFYQYWCNWGSGGNDLSHW